LLAAKADLESAKAAERSARAQGRPSVSVVSRYNFNNQPQSLGYGQYVDATSRDRYLGLQIDIPVFEGFSRTYKVRAAQAQVAAKQDVMRDVELQVAQKVWASYQALNVSSENMKTADDILKNAKLSFEASESRSQRGVSSIIELLSTQNTLANAHQQQIQAVADWQLARIQLAANVGNLGMADLK
ncbi:MAG TPA: TolC family protein, partial [Pseudomonadales bacterium]|nr:TolC family protein [Pseudomonadales bacterium]